MHYFPCQSTQFARQNDDLLPVYELQVVNSIQTKVKCEVVKAMLDKDVGQT